MITSITLEPVIGRRFARATEDDNVDLVFEEDGTSVRITLSPNVALNLGWLLRDQAMVANERRTRKGQLTFMQP
jgi:hypothetical protein